MTTDTTRPTPETPVSPDDPALPTALLAFWFDGTPADPAPRAVWFQRDADFDAALAARFTPATEAALAGGYTAWEGEPWSCLARILLLDQLPRNLYRDTAAAYGGDPLARAATEAALEQGHDAALPPVACWFLYMPLMHSEELAHQDRLMALAEALPAHTGRDQFLTAARQHRDIIARFGRFPHRNAALGRATTAAEAAFLREPGSSF